MCWPPAGKEKPLGLTFRGCSGSSMYGVVTNLALHWDNLSSNLGYNLCKNCHATSEFFPRMITQEARVGSCRARCSVSLPLWLYMSQNHKELYEEHMETCSAHATWFSETCWFATGNTDVGFELLYCPWNLDKKLLLSFYLFQPPQIS